MKIINKYCVLIFFTSIVNAETVHEVENFSDRYSAKIISKPAGTNTYEINEEDFFGEPNAEVIVFDKKQQKPVIEVIISLNKYDLGTNEKIKSNVLNMPYGEQSIIQYDDFNFDGVPDLAIKVGDFSCYGGPVYNIYLGQENGFKFNQELSVIASEYCGMFSVDKKNKTISAMTKSGCCWHKFDTYRIEGDDIWLDSSKEIGSHYARFFGVTEYIADNNKKLHKQEFIFLDQSEDIKSFSFSVTGNKKVVLEAVTNLNYYFVQPQKTSSFSQSVQDALLDYEREGMQNLIELAYPPLQYRHEQSDTFIYQSNNDIDELIFNNGWAEYRIYETKNSVGVKVIRQGKVYDIKGDYRSLKGHLADFVKSVDVENLEIR